MTVLAEPTSQTSLLAVPQMPRRVLPCGWGLSHSQLALAGSDATSAPPEPEPDAPEVPVAVSPLTGEPKYCSTVHPHRSCARTTRTGAINEKDRFGGRIEASLQFCL